MIRCLMSILLIGLNFLVYSQDTVYVFNGDTTTNRPTGSTLVEIDTTTVVETLVDSTVTEITDLSIDSAHLQSDASNPVVSASHTVSYDNSTVSLRAWRLATTNTGNVMVNVNSSDTLLWKENNEFNNAPFNGNFETTLNQNSNDIINFISSNMGRFNYSISITHDDVEYDTTVNTTVYITLDYPQSIETIETHGFIVFPNPTSGTLNTPQNVEYSIINLNGQVVKRGYSSGELNLDEISKGAYFIQVDGTVVKFFKR
ncbi:MAG: T9SS type A sorting domain-containing protein [Cryomorphaceae bacterium]